MDESDWYNAEVYVRGTNLLAKFSKQSGNVKTDYQYYTQNAHGDIVNLTDAQGAITKSYKYDAFGVEQNIDDSDSNAFRYCGEYYDAETGTIYLRARYYNPSTGRFISRDSYAGNTGAPLSLNLYTYCQNNPIIAIDPSGHMSIKEFWQGSKQCWRDGINEMKSMGGGARFFANYSEGIMDTLGGQINAVRHPLKTAKAMAADYASACKSDIRNIDVMNYVRTKALTSVFDGLTNFGKACYNKNWDSVAHQLGGGTVLLGEACATQLATEAIISKFSTSVSSVSPTLQGGKARAAQFSDGWQNGSMFETVRDLAPNSQPYISESGKLIYPNTNTGIQVVYDIEGNYFRIQNTLLSGKRTYLDINGNQIPNNIVVNGKQKGLSQGDYNRMTHFNNTDVDFPF